MVQCQSLVHAMPPKKKVFEPEAPTPKQSAAKAKASKVLKTTPKVKSTKGKDNDKDTDVKAKAGKARKNEKPDEPSSSTKRPSETDGEKAASKVSEDQLQRNKEFWASFKKVKVEETEETEGCSRLSLAD